MKLKILLYLVLAFVFAVSGCVKSGSVTPPQDTLAVETPETIPDDSETETKPETDDNGDVLITETDDSGNVITQIIYTASTNITEKYIYEYDENGNLIHEYNYSADGNFADEFKAGNYENANGFGEIYYDIPSDHYINMDEAFSVTVEELAPLYAKAEQLWVTYGVTVLIADKVSDYTDGAELCFEYDQISACLDLIESCLSCYPKDFFRDFDADVCIQLVGSGSASGLYMSGYERRLIQIDVNCYTPDDEYDNGYFFCYTLHHETAHMISETLMKRAEQSQVPLTEELWNSYNPEGFSYVYGYDDEKEIEIYDSGSNYEYFVYSYGCSTPDEDRSIVFGEAMTYYQGYESSGFTEYVKAKLMYYSDCIKAGFKSDSWDDIAPWEHILNK
ncbi:MAG: hypothetical protein IJ017_02510 [Oscillospiraceae bacterium]|nr:hypothetical protein [Oscillospiraceae bacterium]